LKIRATSSNILKNVFIYNVRRNFSPRIWGKESWGNLGKRKVKKRIWGKEKWLESLIFLGKLGKNQVDILLLPPPKGRLLCTTHDLPTNDVARTTDRCSEEVEKANPIRLITRKEFSVV
jgi:hypothetical protein